MCKRVSTMVATICLIAVGCNSQTDHESTTGSSVVESSAVSLVLDKMPEGDVFTPSEIKELGDAETSAIVAGRIDAGTTDPFQPGEIAFMISQLPDEGHGAEDPDHADNCPFCKRKLANAPKAIIQFRDSDGNVRSGDPRQTLSLDKGDVVYVTGLAQYDPAVNTVMVDATGVFRKAD